MSFGEYVKGLRIAQKTTLRQFCAVHQLDPSNWSKVEREINPAPKDQEALEEWAKYFKLKPKTQEWDQFMDEARISRGEIPKDILKDKEALALLPAFFKTVRGVEISEDQVEQLIAKIREANAQGRTRLERVVKKIALGQETSRDDLNYWMSRPPAERIEAVDLLRKERYGSSLRLQGHARVIKQL